jgi:flagellar biosynthetic protein FliR
MFTVTYAQLNAWMTAFLWPFVRILALIATAPVLGQSVVPVRVKIGLAAFMAIAVAPALGPLPQVTVFSASGVWIIVNQFLIGVALGLTMHMVFAAVEATGTVAGMQMGLSFATFFSPQSDGTSMVMAQFMNMIATLTFLALDGHLQMISTLVNTFTLLPISATPLAAAGWHAAASWGGVIFSSGLLLALPMIAALLIANLALGILNRAAPQIGIFQIGFPITMLVGFFILLWMLPNLAPFLSHLFELSYDQMERVAAGWRR